MRSSALLAVVGALLAAAPAIAQPADDPVVRPQLLNTTRVESWSFFEPHAGGGDPDYALISNRARLAVAVDARRLAFEGSFQYAQLLGLPSNAFGPGPLGPGALYFFASRTPQAYQLYFKTMSLTLKDVLPRLSVRAGRMLYASDEETPHPGRLIGEAEWTVFERSFDGVRADYRRQAWRAHAAFLMPTQGAFEESASPTIGKVQVATGELNSRYGQVFAHNYRDTRAVRARPDNTGLAADRVDINVQTFGGSASVFDVHLWGAVQRGDWYGHAHRAWAASAEHRAAWDAGWRPALRAGVFYASGDRDPGDRTHGTFFAMIPTTRPDLLRGTIAQMNLRDVHASISLSPRSRLQLSAALHHLALARRLDRWYSGTGATAFDGTYFGFSSRGSTLRTGLGVYGEVGARATLRNYWSVGVSAGVMRGGDVVRRQFAGRTLWVAAVDTVLAVQ